MAYNNVKVKERQVVSPNTQTKPIGIVSEVPMNEWDHAVSYEKLNLVTYKNATFIAKRANMNIPPFDTDGWENTWMLLRAGIGISATVVEYASGSTSSPTPPEKGWSSEFPVFQAGQLLWTRITITYTDNTSTMFYSVGVAVAPTKTSELINDGNGTSPFATEKELETETARAKSVESGLDVRVKTIESEIPSDASADNKLATQSFTNSSINNIAAFYITYNAQSDAFPTRAALTGATTFYNDKKPRVPTTNDYAIVRADESQPKNVDGSYPTTRYIYQGGTYPQGSWSFQWIINNTPFTQAQINALNSGISTSGVEQIATNKKDIADEIVRAKAAEQANADATDGKVNKSGDAMTGNLTINNGAQVCANAATSFSGNINTLTRAGQYGVASNASNIPIAQAGILYVATYAGTTWVQQTYITNPDEGTIRMYRRGATDSTNTSWSAWAEFYNKTETDNAISTAIDNAITKVLNTPV